MYAVHVWDVVELGVPRGKDLRHIREGGQHNRTGGLECREAEVPGKGGR